MKKNKIKVWISRMKACIKAMRFSTLDMDVKSYMNNEIFFHNNRRAVVVSWIILVLEAINIVHVLFFSKSGLSTFNNRQYFAMYLFLLISGIICLIVRQLFQKKRQLLQSCYTAFTLFWAVWHAGLSIMDLHSNPNITVFITGILGLSFLMQLKPYETIFILPGSLLVLFIGARNTITSGIAINALIVTVVATLISCSRYYSILEALNYRRKMVLQANHRTEEQEKINLLEKQQKVLLDCSKEMLFVWDKKAGTLNFTNGKALSEPDQKALLTWFAKNDGQKNEMVTFHLNSKHTVKQCQVVCMAQYNSDDMLLGAAGCIREENDFYPQQNYERK